jgi:RNA polymerase primary sigma factor
MRNALAIQARTIRLPVSALARRSVLGRASNRLAQELGRDPSHEELSRATGVAPDSIADVMRMAKEPLSLDAPRSDDQQLTLGDSLSDTTSLTANDRMWAKELAAEIEALIERLTPREQLVLRLRFGLDQEDEHTFEEIGNTLGLTRERVRQIVAAALTKLNRASQARPL